MDQHINLLSNFLIDSDPPPALRPFEGMPLACQVTWTVWGRPGWPPHSGICNERRPAFLFPWLIQQRSVLLALPVSGDAASISPR